MARLNGARLLMLEKGDEKVVREIPVRTSQVQIGSNPTKNTIRLNSAGVEPSHCKIFVKNDQVFIANYSAKNPISVNKIVVPKRAALTDGSILEICGTQFRWKFDDSKLVRSEKAKKTEHTPTSSKFGNRRRTTLLRKKQPAIAGTTGTAAGGSGKKPATKRAGQQKTPTYTLPKNHKQLLKNMRKRFTVHNIMTRQNTEDGGDEDNVECEDSVNMVEHTKQAESPKPTTPQKSFSTTSSVANTPFYTPEPEKENSIPVSKTPMLQLENSAMMILSYTPAIGSRSKANIQKTPISASRSAQRLNYLTPKNENISISGTPQKTKAGNSMYLIDLTTPNSGHSSFVCSPMLDTHGSLVGSPKVGLIDLTTPSPKKVKTPTSVLKSTQHKTLLKSALKNASRTPITTLRTATATPVTPKTVPKISLNDTPIKSAASTRSNKTPVRGSARGGSIRSKLEISNNLQPAPVRMEANPSTLAVVQLNLAESKEANIMTTDELFDTLVGRQSIVKTYERKSTSPKKTPCPLILAKDTNDMPKTDIDLWVESVVAAVSSPEPVNIDAIIRKPNQTTQVRSSQYSDITPHESFVEGTSLPSTSEVIDPETENVAVDVYSPDELDNMTDKPIIPNSNRKSETPLASKIARSLDNKRQTIGNFFTNIFGKLAVSPVTRISIANDSTNLPGEEEPNNGEDSDGSEEVYHDSETSHAVDVSPKQTGDGSTASSPKLRQSLRDTRKFIGNAWTSLNTSRPQLDNTAEVDESLLLSDTYNETEPDAANDSFIDEVYDLTDLGSRTTKTQPPITPTHRQSLQSAKGELEISPLANPLESTLNKSVSHCLERDETGNFIISPNTVTTATSPITLVSGQSQQNVIATPSPKVTSSRRSSRRQTLQQADAVVELDESTVSSPVVVVESTEPNDGEDVLKENCLINWTARPEQSEISEELSQDSNTESVLISMDQTIPTEGEGQLLDEYISKGQSDSGNNLANSTLEHFDTSEMEPLEVTEGNESELEMGLPKTTPPNDVVGSARRTRNSIATTQAFTPNAVAAKYVEVTLSESKLPLRGLWKTAMIPKKYDDEPGREIDSLENSISNINNELELATEKTGHFDKLSNSCIDQVEAITITSEKNKTVTSDEILLAQENVSFAPREASLATIALGVKSIDATARQELSDTIVNEQTFGNESLNLYDAARRNTRNSLAIMTATPKSAAVAEVLMSESKLSLRKLKATGSANFRLELNSKKTLTKKVSAIENSSATAVKSESESVAVENNDESSTVENVLCTPNTSLESSQPTNRTPVTHILAEDGVCSSRSSSRSTPQIVSSSTLKSIPSDTTPLLKSVLQKVVKASANETKPTPSSKLELSEFNADACVQLDQLYETPTLRATRRKTSNTSTPNIADSSLKLDELYKSPPATPASVKRRGATPKGSVRSDNDNESLPLQSVTPQKDINLSVVDSPSSENKLKSSVDKSPNMQELNKTPFKDVATQLLDVAGTPKDGTPPREADMCLSFQQMYQTPAQETPANLQKFAAKNLTLNERKDAETRSILQEIIDSPNLAIKCVSVVDVQHDNTPKAQPNVDMSLNLQELYQTPPQALCAKAHQSLMNRSKTPKTGTLQADMSLNLQHLYKTPARSTRQSSVVIVTPKSDEDADVCKTNITLNLQDLYKTPAKLLRSNTVQSAVKKSETTSEHALQTDVSLNRQEVYKTPARPTCQSSAVKSVPNSAVDANISKGEAYEAVKLSPDADVTLNIQELYETPVRSKRTNALQTNVENSALKEGTVEADVSLNLKELYRTPARSTRQSSAVKSPPQSAADTNISQVENEAVQHKPNADMSFNLQALYKTPARTLRGVSQLTPATGAAKMSTPTIRAAQPEPEDDLSLNLEQLYKTPARTKREATQRSAVKPIKISKVTPQKDFDKSAVDVTPTAQPSQFERTPIAKISEPEADISFNLNQIYQTPARRSSTDEKVRSMEPCKAETNITLNLDQLYKTPARTLRGVSQIASMQTRTPTTEQTSEVDMSLNLPDLYKTPAQALPDSETQHFAAEEANVVVRPSADKSLNLQDLHRTPAQSHHVSETTVQVTIEESCLNVESLFKTPARTTRGKLPRSTAKVTPHTIITPLRTSRSTSKSAVNTSVQEQLSVSMIESELASSIVRENMESGIVNGKAISSSTPLNPRIRKSTLVAAVGLMSPLNSSEDATITFSNSEMHTEAIGITTIDRSTAVDQAQASVFGVFVAAQSRLLYDESCSETMQGDPLQVTSSTDLLKDNTCALEVSTTQMNETTQRNPAEFLLEQNETLIEAKMSEQAERSTEISQSCTINHEKVSETLDSRSDMETSPVRNVAEPDVVASLNLLNNEHTTKTEKTYTAKKGKPADALLNTSSELVEHQSKTIQKSPLDPSTPSAGANKSTCETQKMTPTRVSMNRLSTATTSQTTPANVSKQCVSATVNISTIKQGFVAVKPLPETPSEVSLVLQSIAEGKSDDNFPYVNVAVDPADVPAQISEKIDNESIPEQSVTNMLVVPPGNSDASSDSVMTKEPDTAATYLESLGVDPVLLQQIHERVDTLERELAEMNDITQSSSTFLERSDEQSIDIQESESEVKLQDNTQTPKPMKRRLYTKTAPDDSTPERRESIGDHRVTSSKHVYIESDNDKRVADTSSEEPKKVEPVKVLPSRASRRKIVSLSEEALAGASPELKFIKPKQTKIATTDEPPHVHTSVNTSETEQSDQETSLGRRKVVFNEHIQVKEINSPAFIGEIIKKTSLRGRGRNNKQSVTVTVDQHAGRSIKPATKRTKIVEVVGVESPQEGTDKIEHNPSQAGTSKSATENGSKTAPLDRVVDKLVKQSEEEAKSFVDEPAAKRSRAKKAPTAKQIGSRILNESVAEDGFEKSNKISNKDVPVEPACGDKVKTDPVDDLELEKQSEKIDEASVDESTAKRSRGKKSPANKRIVSIRKNMVESIAQCEAETDPNNLQEGTHTVETVDSENKSSRVAKTRQTSKKKVEPVVEDPSKQSEETVDVPLGELATRRGRKKKATATKRIGYKTKIESQEELTSANESQKENSLAAPVKPSAKRSRRGAKDASDVAETVVTEPNDEDEKNQKELKVVEPVSKRVRNAHESKTKMAVETTVDGSEEQTIDAEDVDGAQTKITTKPTNHSRRGKKQIATIRDAVQTESEDQPAEVQERPRRVARGKTASAQETVQIENAPTADELDVKLSGMLSSSSDGHEEEKSALQSKTATNKVTHRSRGATQNDTVESSDLPQDFEVVPLTVEKAIADSTSHDATSAGAVDIKPDAKRSRRAPKTVRSRRGQKPDSETESSVAAVETPVKQLTEQTRDEQHKTTSEQQEALKVNETEIVQKTTSRGRGAKKKTPEEQSSARMPSPSLPPPAVDEQPAKRVGRQVVKRVPRKATNSDPVSVEISMNESHMVKTMLPASHTSTPLLKNTLNADAAEIHSGTRGRRAATNPVIAALIEESTPRTRARRGVSATPEVQVETPSTPVKRGRGRGAGVKVKVVEEEIHSTVTETSQTSTTRSRGKNVAKEVVEQVELTVESEPATKRSRKVPAKLREDTDNPKKEQPPRGRRGAKAKTEESNVAAINDEMPSVGSSEEKPKRKPRAAAAKRTANKVDDQSDASVPEDTQEEEAPKSPPPKRTRKGAR